MTMPYANPRRCVEQALPPRLLHRWLSACVAGQHAAFLRGEATEDVPQSDRDLLATLRDAYMEAFADLEGKTRQAAERRLDRLQAEALAPYSGAVLVKVFLTIAYLWRDLLQDGHCVLIEGSKADRAYEIITRHVLAEAEDVAASADRSGEKAARRMRRWLEGQGYYKGRAAA